MWCSDGRQLADFSLVDQPIFGLRLSGLGFRSRKPNWRNKLWHWRLALAHPNTRPSVEHRDVFDRANGPIGDGQVLGTFVEGVPVFEAPGLDR